MGSARLGMIATTARWLVPLLLDKLAMAHPGVRLVTTEATSSALGVLLAAGGLDCAVVNLPLGHPGTETEATVRRGHRAADSQGPPPRRCGRASYKGPRRALS